MSLQKLVYVFFVVFFFSGCATTYKVDPKQLEKFVDKPTVPNDKTGVYLIRGNNMLGAARKAWVAVNESVVASLPNSTNVYLELDSGLNTVHLVQGLAGFGYKTVDNLPGETRFLVIDYASGRTTQVETDLGKTMVVKTRAIQPLPSTRENTAYDNAILNPGLLDYELMVESDKEKLVKDQSTALVTFYRPGALGEHVAFDIWSQDGFVGSTKGGRFFKVKFKPGKYSFVARSENYAILSADLEAGKEYAVELVVSMGWNQAHVKLLPVDLNDKTNRVHSWENLMTYTVINESVVNGPAIAPRIDWGKQYLHNVFAKVESGKVDKRELPESFGR